MSDFNSFENLNNNNNQKEFWKTQGAKTINSLKKLNPSAYDAFMGSMSIFVSLNSKQKVCGHKNLFKICKEMGVRNISPSNVIQCYFANKKTDRLNA